MQQGRLESACALLVAHNIVLDTHALTRLIGGCLKRVKTSRNEGDIRTSIRYQHRATALAMVRDAGRLSGAVIPSVVMPDGYCGKVMLAFVKGDCIPGRTFLRSGDDWHREILRHFEEELRSYGFEKFQFSPQGGAFAEFQPDGSIALYGSSEEFGPCRQEDALMLVQTAFSDRNVHWSDTADQ